MMPLVLPEIASFIVVQGDFTEELIPSVSVLDSEESSPISRHLVKQ